MSLVIHLQGRGEEGGGLKTISAATGGQITSWTVLQSITGPHMETTNRSHAGLYL